MAGAATTSRSWWGGRSSVPEFRGRGRHASISVVRTGRRGRKQWSPHGFGQRPVLQGHHPRPAPHGVSSPARARRDRTSLPRQHRLGRGRGAPGDAPRGGAARGEDGSQGHAGHPAILGHAAPLRHAPRHRQRLSPSVSISGTRPRGIGARGLYPVLLGSGEASVQSWRQRLRGHLSNRPAGQCPDPETSGRSPRRFASRFSATPTLRAPTAS